MNQTSDRDKIPEPFKRLPCVRISVLDPVGTAA